MLNDIRYALRLMRRTPGFTAVAVISLALGIGANTAIFSLINTIMLRQLAVAHPEQLVEFLEKRPGEARGDGYLGWEKYESFRDRNHVFAALTGTSFDNLASVRADASAPETLIAENVLGNYFSTLGLQPALGRLIGPEDVPASGNGDVAVVSWFYWETRFHRDPSILGKRIFVNGTPMTIVGVAPRAYTGPRIGSRTDVWTPRERDQVSMIGRLKPGVTLAQAQAEMSVLFQIAVEQSAARRHEKVSEVKLELAPAGAGFAQVRDQYGRSLTLLMSAVGLLLVLACINMAGMLLARAAGRQREMAVRVGLGASRGRLMRQVLTESILLSASGALAGVVAACFGTGALVRIMASGRPHEHIDLQVAADWHVLLFTMGIALATGVLFGLAPAWYAFHAAPATSLRQAGVAGRPQGDTWFWRWFGKGLVAAQVALSILLVTAAALFVGHLSRIRNLEPGFRSDHVLLVFLNPEAAGHTAEQLAGPYQNLLARLEGIPGVRAASITGCTPLQGCGYGVRNLSAEGNVEPPEDRHWNAAVWAGPRHFETLGVPMLAGRDFSFRDAQGPRVTIVSESLARRYFPGGNALGKHLTIVKDSISARWHDGGQSYEIVGIVGDAKWAEIHEPAGRTMYFNVFQQGPLLSQLELRTTVDPASVAGAVRDTVHDVLKTVPIQRVTTLAAQVDAAIVPERLVATLSGYFGALGATLAGIGLYGLLAYTVARRTSEIGIRMALGATASNVAKLVLGDAMAMVCAGVVVGMSMVLWSRPVAARLLDDVKLESASPLVVGGGTIIAVAVLAAYLPARRAARVDPMVALRHE